MKFISEYLGLNTVHLSSVQIASRIIVVFITFLFFIRLSGVRYLLQDIETSQSYLEFLITLTVIFILILSVFNVGSFLVYIMSALVFGVLLWISSYFP